MGTYKLACEFDVVRRIGWSDEELGEHIDTVFDRLHQADGVREIDTGADLDTGRSSLSLTIMTFDDDPHRIATSALGVAIRSCGGAHVGLLESAEEAVVRPERNQLSGLRIPTWKIRQMDLETVSPD